MTNALRYTTLLIAALNLMLLGCDTQRTASSQNQSAEGTAHHEPIQYTSSCLGNARFWQVPDDELVFTEWATSEDGALSYRLMVPKAPATAEDPMLFLAELRNNTDKPINVLRPLRDHYLAYYILELVGPDGPLEYTGPDVSHTLDEQAFMALPPDHVDRGDIELSVYYFAGSDKPGRYTIKCPYEVVNYFRELASRSSYDMPDLWVGEIVSESITIEQR